jgi:hypothetical protein
MVDPKRIRENQVKGINNIQQDEHQDSADAKRVLEVDESGNPYNSTNRKPVEATVNLTASKPGNPVIFNSLVTTANTQYSIILPDKTERFTVSVRSKRAITLQYSFITGQTNTNFVTVPPGSTREITNIGLSGVKNLYFELNLIDVGGTTVEVEAWHS